MSERHSFVIVRVDEFDPANARQFAFDPAAIRLDDDVLHYMHDTVLWIPTFNPLTQEPSRGLNYWGPTLIRDDGAGLAESVFASWANLFAQGPEIIELTGPYCWEEGQPDERGHYEKFELRRAETIAALARIAGLASDVNRAGGPLYLLHVGV